MKKKIATIALLLSLAGCSQTPCSCDNNLGVTDETEKEKIDNFEEIYKQLSTKYKHIKKYEVNNEKYLVNEYETPNGEVGYQVIKDDGEFIESVCIGAECDGKNYKINKEEYEKDLF